MTRAVQHSPAEPKPLAGAAATTVLHIGLPLAAVAANSFSAVAVAGLLAGLTVPSLAVAVGVTAPV